MAELKTIVVERKDPVCGMAVPADTAADKIEHHGATWYFCGKGCAEKFRANPGQYLSASDGLQPTSAPEAGEYTCPMHPEVRQEGPGSCPSCGMALEPATPTPATRTEYTCPMHPEIVRSEPGACPICGMALEPRTVTAEESNPEYDDMCRRFWASVILTLPIFAVMISGHCCPGKIV